MRVACFSPYPADGPSVRHRIYAYGPIWRDRGVELTVLPFMTGRFYSIRRKFGWHRTAEKLFWFAVCSARLLWNAMRLSRFDAVIIHREAFPLGPPVFEQLAGRAVQVLFYDIDDALWHPPSNTVNQRRWFADRDRVAKIMTACQHVVVGNNYVLDYAVALGRPVTLIPTSYDDLGGAGLDRPPGGHIVLAWIGNTGNAWYLRDLVRIIERISLQHPVVLRLIGGDDIADIRSDTLSIDRRRWSLAEERRLVEADIGIMPLPDLEYERGKSGFKIIQYWSAGLGVVASPVGLNAQLIQDHADGLLASTDAEWEAALRTVITDRAARQALGRTGYARFRAEFSREENACKWIEIFANCVPTRSRAAPD